MAVQFIDILFILAYFVIVLMIGFLSSRKETKEGFLIADRKVKVLPLAASLCAGLVGGGILITTTALAFQHGLSFMWLYMGAALGFFIFPIFGKRIKKLGDKHNFYTLSDYFYKLFGSKNGLLSAIVIFVMFFSLILVQFIAGGKILSSIMDIPYSLAVLITGAVVFVYLVLGGFKAVIKTDFFQYILMFILGFILLLSLKNLDFSSQQFNLFAIGIEQIIGFTILGAFVIFVQADIWQRAYASYNTKVLKKSFILAGILLLIFGLSIGMIGINAKNAFPDITPDNALIFGFGNILPTGFLGLALVLLFASIMSTLDTAVFVTAMNISNDLLLKFKKIEEKNLQKIIKLSIFGLVTLGLLFALLIQSIIGVVFALISLGLCMAPAIIGSFYKKLKERAVFLSVLTGFLSVVILVVTSTISEETAVISLPVSFVFLIVGQYIFKK